MADIIRKKEQGGVWKKGKEYKGAVRGILNTQQQYKATTRQKKSKMKREREKAYTQ